MSGLFLFLSCQQNTKASKEKAFCDTIHLYSNYEIKEIQQKLIDEMSKTLDKIGVNNDEKIDTKYLRDLLDSSRKANELSREKISSLKEVDNEINLRRKSLDVITALESAYNNEFEKAIQIFESHNMNKVEKVSEILHSKLLEIKRVRDIANESHQEMLNKYNLPGY
jgi:hypothetical protein